MGTSTTHCELGLSPPRMEPEYSLIATIAKWFRDESAISSANWRDSISVFEARKLGFVVVLEWLSRDKSDSFQGPTDLQDSSDRHLARPLTGSATTSNPASERP